MTRSQSFFSEDGVAGLTHRAFTAAMGYDSADMNRPLIGICNTYSELNPCNSHLCANSSEAVKRGILQAGGFPLEFPTISLGEIHLSPTSMLYRNLAAMDTEEMIRGNPLDGVVLLTNCDKTTPAALMGAASADIPRHHAQRRTDAQRALQRAKSSAPAPTAGATPPNTSPAKSAPRPIRRSEAQPRPQPRPLHGHGHRLDHGIR